MNIQSTFVFAGAFALALAARGNPLGFPSYEREVEAVFATPAEAAKAEMKICALPDGAKIAFTTRWDDSSSKHLAKRDMLNEAGYKGTFFLIGDERFAQAKGAALIAGGNALGAHTMTHPSLWKGSVAKMFSEVLLNRIMIERAADFPVVSFVIPFSWNTPDRTRQPKLVRILCDTGLYVSSDWPMSNSPAGFDKWMPGYTFEASDKKPDEKRFHFNLKRSVKSALAGKYPKVTFGIHSWCDDAGNEVQGELLSRYAGNPEWFYGNDNEYGAHRYAGLHGKVGRKSVKGKKAVFSITMFDPAFTGSDIPVSVRFTSVPEKVSVGGAALVERRGTYRVPHSLGTLTKADSADKAGRFRKFPGLEIRIVPDEAKATLALEVKNGTGTKMKDVVFTVLPAPGWSNSRIVSKAGALDKGVLKRSFDLGKKTDDPDYWADPVIYAASVDFRIGAKACRAWTVSNERKN